MRDLFASWVLWASLSAAFAALTAIFAKVGVENVNSDFATFIRTVVILVALGAILGRRGNGRRPAAYRAAAMPFSSYRALRPARPGSAISARSSSGRPPRSRRSTS